MMSYVAGSKKWSGKKKLIVLFCLLLAAVLLLPFPTHIKCTLPCMTIDPENPSVICEDMELNFWHLNYLVRQDKAVGEIHLTNPETGIPYELELNDQTLFVIEQGTVTIWGHAYVRKINDFVSGIVYSTEDFGTFLVQIDDQFYFAPADPEISFDDLENIFVGYAIHP